MNIRGLPTQSTTAYRYKFGAVGTMMTISMIKNSYSNQITSSYLILARILALLSVFWNSARMSCLISLALKVWASGPLPSSHRSAMSCRLDINTSITSCSLVHLATHFRSCTLALRLLSVLMLLVLLLLPSGGENVNNSGAFSVTTLRRACSCTASSVEMSSNAVMQPRISTTIEFSSVPSMIWRWSL